MAEDAERWATMAAGAASSKKAIEPVVLAVGDVLAITDFFVVTSASNTRQVRTIADEIERQISESGGPKPLRTEGRDDLRWVLVDYGDFVVHVFLDEARHYYELERLWSDVPRGRVGVSSREGIGLNDIIRRGALDRDHLGVLQNATSAIQQWPAGSHVWGHYAEQTEAGPAICRTENVSVCDPTVRGLVDGVLLAVASDALGEPVVPFKDKLNYKQPGGAGFSPHQDVVAYPGVSRVMSVLVAIDDCSLESGCLWLAGGVDRTLPTDDRGAVHSDAVAGLQFSAAELQAGDAVCIDGFAPHYSEANRSANARRVLVASYAPTSEGYTRSQYYDARQTTMTDASARDGRFRISTLADFEGDEVTPDEVAHGECTHPRS